MKTQHTPGPWYQVGSWVEVEDEDTPDICTCNPEAIGQSHLKWDWKTVHANARLIAAAPDLLAALNVVFAESEKAISMLGIPLVSADWHESARAAIAKATGGQA